MIVIICIAQDVCLISYHVLYPGLPLRMGKKGVGLFFPFLFFVLVGLGGVEVGLWSALPYSWTAGRLLIMDVRFERR